MENRFRRWPLQSQERLRRAAVVGPGARPQMLRDPAKIFGNIRGIDNQQKTVRGQAAHGQIIEQPSGLIAQGTVLQLVDLQRADVIQRQVL